VDSSGNKLYSDIGKAFSDELIKYCKEETRPKPIKITLKYIDPSYMVRSVKPNAFDAGYCAYNHLFIFV
jgi:6-phosphofructokinase 1